MKESLRTFFRNNKKLILSVFIVWGFVLIAVLVVAAYRNSLQQSSLTPKVPPGYIAPIPQSKKELILNETDPYAVPVIISDTQKQKLLNKKDTGAIKTPNLSNQEKELIIQGN
jgi:hypothetical protein